MIVVLDTNIFVSALLSGIIERTGLPQIAVFLVIGAVIGEFVGASEGLGWVIVNSGANVNTSLAFAAMAILALVSVVLFYGIALVERLVVPWARHRG